MTVNYLVAGMLGIMLFFTAVVAPTIFKVLPSNWSGIYVRSFFPRYYLVLAAISVTCILLESNEVKRILLAGCGLLFVFNLTYLTNQINKAKDNGHNKTFNYLHGLSIVINLIQVITFSSFLLL
jgi:hypothetical protein